MMTAMQPTDLAADNPFGAPSTLPYGLPDFTRIREEHYRPALLAGMAAAARGDRRDRVRPRRADRREHARGARTLRPPAAPRGRGLLQPVQRRLHPGLDAIEEELAPQFSAHLDAIYLDPRLFARVAALQADVDSGALELEPDTAWLLHRTHTKFVRSGVGLDEASQDRLRALNAEIMSLEAEFGRLLLAATNAAGVLVTDEDELDGLPEDARDAAALAARVAWPRAGLVPRARAAHAAGAAGRAARPWPARAGLPRVGRARGVRAARHPRDAAEPGPHARRARPAARVRAPRGVRRRGRDRARPRRPSRTSSSGSPRWPSPTPAPRVPTWPRRSGTTTPAPGWSRGTGSSTPSRSRRSAARSTTRSCAPTWSWSGCWPTGCSARRTSSTASRSRSATTSWATTRTCACSRCSTRTAASSACSSATSGRASPSAAARG